MAIATIKEKTYTLQYTVDAATKDAVFDRLLQFFCKHGAFSGESVMQCDGPQIEAAPLLSDIADDLFKFEVEWID